MTNNNLLKEVTVKNFPAERMDVLSKEALEFIIELHQVYNPVRENLLLKRKLEQEKYNQGFAPDFLPETSWIRRGDWKINEIQKELRKRGLSPVIAVVLLISIAFIFS